MLQSLKSRIRQLWTQCDLFDASPGPGGTPDDRTDSRLGVASPPVSTTPPSAPRSPVRQPPSRAAAPPFTSGLPLSSSGKHPQPPRVPRSHPADARFVHQLTEAYHRYNAELFGNTLHPVALRISRRMKNRLGHYMLATPTGLPAEIAISRRHIRRDSWEEVLHTLVHEMVHQWQDESGLPVDHGQHFRHKARQVGIRARATRHVTGAS